MQLKFIILCEQLYFVNVCEFDANMIAWWWTCW